jgi:hypothetical protein
MLANTEQRRTGYHRYNTANVAEESLFHDVGECKKKRKGRGAEALARR